ncbi:MAG TPA: DUF3574 domain-containing protein [Bacteroidia bacterium]|nr:DUF3574 domain-containing protein [Bacteroidia bacterium]
MRIPFFIPLIFLLACNPGKQPASLSCPNNFKTELYFGLKVDSATVVTDEKFNEFIRKNMVSANLGLTIVNSEGRWLNTATGKMDSENSKLVVLVYNACDTAVTHTISKAVRAYNSEFSQQSVLRVDYPIAYDFVDER